jgi:hypothetical protein
MNKGTLSLTHIIREPAEEVAASSSLRTALWCRIPGRPRTAIV